MFKNPYSIGELPAKRSLALVSDTFESRTYQLGREFKPGGAGLRTAKTGLRDGKTERNKGRLGSSQLVSLMPFLFMMVLQNRSGVPKWLKKNNPKH